jgi:hypothetical protein
VQSFNNITHVGEDRADKGEGEMGKLVDFDRFRST